MITSLLALAVAIGAPIVVDVGVAGGRAVGVAISIAVIVAGGVTFFVAAIAAGGMEPNIAVITAGAVMLAEAVIVAIGVVGTMTEDVAPLVGSMTLITLVAAVVVVASVVGSTVESLKTGQSIWMGWGVLAALALSYAALAWICLLGGWRVFPMG